MLAKVSWNNIWRNPKRSLVLILSIVLGLWAGVFVMGFYTGLINQRIDDVIQKEAAHIQIHHPKFEEEKLFKYQISNSKEILLNQENKKEIKAISGRVLLQGMVASSKNSRGIQIIGVDPEKENLVRSLKEDLLEGTYFEKIRRNPVLISKKLAEKLKVKIRSKIVLTFQDANYNIISGAFRVEGLFKTGNGMFDETNLFIRKKDISRILGSEINDHEIAILLKTNDALDLEHENLSKEYSELKIEKWYEIIPGMKFILESMDTTLYVILWIIMLALMFGIVNTMLMAVLERTKELGMLMAIGMNKLKVFQMIIFETVLILLIGGPIGILLAYLTISFFKINGIDISIVGEGLESLGYATIIYPHLEVSHYLNISFQVVLMALIGSIYPAIRALRLKPAEVVR